jgi:hypothetical protein
MFSNLDDPSARGFAPQQFSVADYFSNIFKGIAAYASSKSASIGARMSCSNLSKDHG